MAPIEEIVELFETRGLAEYFGEAVSQREHGLQAAHLARKAGASDELIVAALLHDIGHLICGLSEDAASHGIDDTHESVGADWLERHFGPSVSDPVRLHVPAKRYLCAVEKEYYEQLSPASKLSLKLQGGPMSPEQVEFFENGPHFTAAIALRRWDDEAKIPRLPVPPIESYRETILSALKRSQNT